MSPEIEARLHAASIPERNRAILDAHAEGCSFREIARKLGMTHGGVRKIILKEQPS